jgi:hypothetical protein
VFILNGEKRQIKQWALKSYSVADWPPKHLENNYGRYLENTQRSGGIDTKSYFELVFPAPRDAVFSLEDVTAIEFLHIRDRLTIYRDEKLGALTDFINVDIGIGTFVSGASRCCDDLFFY